MPQCLHGWGSDGINPSGCPQCDELGREQDKAELAKLRAEREARERIFVFSVMWLDADGNEPKGREARRFRTWGWFKTLASAEETIFSNDADVYEDGYYNTVVVEEMPWGSLALSVAEHWYSAVAKVEDGRVAGYDVKKIDKPKSLEHVCSWGMG